MKPQLQEGKDNALSVPEIRQLQPPPTNGIQRTKYIVVSAVVVAAIVILGIVLTVYFCTKSTENIVRQQLKFTDDNGRDVEEDVEVDENNNVARFTVRTEEGTYHIVHDYNRRLRTVLSPLKDHCFVSVLNASEHVRDLKHTKNGEKIGDDSTVLKLVEDETPIPEPSFMSSAASAMCESREVHWAYSTCDSTATSSEVAESQLSAKLRCYQYLARTRYCYWVTLRYRCYYYNVLRVSCYK